MNLANFRAECVSQKQEKREIQGSLYAGVFHASPVLKIGSKKRLCKVVFFKTTSECMRTYTVFCLTNTMYRQSAGMHALAVLVEQH